jgi:hypothetical protein
LEEADSSRLSAAAGRRFAWTLAGAFAALGVLATWRGRDRTGLILAALTILFLLGGLVAPTRLGPIEKAWMAFARAISRVTTPIFMAIVYFLVITPTALVRRKLGKRTLSPPRSASTFWVERERRDPESARRRMERQF